MSEKFTMFWGGFCSQFHPCTFYAEVAGKVLKFNCAEQYMMYCKAMCFKDYETAEKIMATTLAKDAKALGRQVRGFNDEQWMTVAQGIVFTGNFHKFTQNPELKKQLLATVGTTLVEASPVDKRWGIGLAEDDPRAQHRSQWRGQNLLGETLTQLREMLIERDKTRTTVVNVKTDDFDVYIGRGKSPKDGTESIWGNPFSYKEGTLAKFKAKDRNDSINKFREWIKTQPELIARIHMLKGKKLGCWCKPEYCHGDILAAIADGLE